MDQQSNRIGKRIARCRVLQVLGILLLVLTEVGDCKELVRGDRAEVLQAVGEYLEAENLGDWAKVWAMLAPSSIFKRSNTYDSFLETIRTNPTRLQAYEIVGVLSVEENVDRSKVPRVEKIAAVRVLVILKDKEGPTRKRTSILTFLREGGRWYKG
jgi:hypothetical protein